MQEPVEALLEGGEQTAVVEFGGLLAQGVVGQSEVLAVH